LLYLEIIYLKVNWLSRSLKAVLQNINYSVFNSLSKITNKKEEKATNNAAIPGEYFHSVPEIKQ